MRETFTEGEMGKVAALQRLAYDTVQVVARGLTPGTTEREAAQRLGATLRERGVEGFFHAPFAWFGDRAGFAGFVTPSLRHPFDNLAFANQFFPTDRALAPGQVGILDVAPIKDGLSVDIGYVFAQGGTPSSELEDARRFLRTMRDLILEGVRAEQTMRTIYRRVDDAIAQAGYESAHALYPSRVLGHKIGRMPMGRARSRMLRGFDVRTYLYFASLLARGLPRRSPLWNDSRLADVRPAPGLWAIEPHVRAPGFGAKWEEILVVTDADAHWLDDDLPHVHLTPAA
jgi:Xaa-Pro aminopeptidase